MTIPDIIDTGDLQDASEEAKSQLDPEQDRIQKKVAELILAHRFAITNRRWATDRNTFLNTAFDLDSQYVEWDSARRVVVNVPSPRNAIRRTLNLIKPYNRAQSSRLTAGLPSYQVTGNTSDPNKEDAAELGNDLIPWIEKQIKMRKVRTDTAFWLQRAGTIVAFNLWDFEDSKPFTDIHPPHEVFYYPISARDLHSSSGMGRDLRMSRGEALSLFPDLAGAIGGTGTSESFNAGERTSRILRDFPAGQSGWLGRFSQFAPMAGGDQFGETDEIVLIEFFLEENGILMSSRDNEIFVFPNGLRLVMTTGGEVGLFEDNVYRKVPAVRIAFSDSAGFWSPSPVTPLRPIQQAINWAYSLWEEHLVLSGRPVMLWPRQAKAAWRRLQDLTTRILRYASGPKGEAPSYLNPPDFPTTLPKLLDFLIRMFQDVSGIHEVSKGQLPAAGISGVAIQLLQDQGDSQIGFVVGEMEEGLAAIMEAHLTNMQRFVEEPEMVELAGNSIHQATQFIGTDLQEGVAVSVRPRSAMPKSPAATQAQAKEAWLGGYLNDEFEMPDWRRLLTIMGVGNPERLFDEMQQDKNNAGMEERLILELEPDVLQLIIAFVTVNGRLPEELMPRRYDDHIVHEKRHRRTLKELREEAAGPDSQMNPDAITVLELHWEMTQLPALEQRLGMPQISGFGSAAGQIAPQGQPGAEPQAGGKAANAQRGVPTPTV